MREIVSRHGFRVARLGYTLLDEGRSFEVVRTTDRTSVERSEAKKRRSGDYRLAFEFALEGGARGDRGEV